MHLGKAVPATQEVPSLIYELAQASKQKRRRIRLDRRPAHGGAAAAPRRVRLGDAAASAAGFPQMPFTFIFNGSYFELEHMLRQLTNFATHTRSGA